MSGSTRGTQPLLLSAAAVGRELPDQFVPEFVMECRRNPGTWLPVDGGIFFQLQAKPLFSSATRGADFEWFGLLAGGGRIMLPHSYLTLGVAGFSREFLRKCIRLAPSPQSCSEGGAVDASLSGTWGGATASTTVVVAAPLIHYRQGGAVICIVFSTALISAVAQGPDELPMCSLPRRTWLMMRRSAGRGEAPRLRLRSLSARP